MPVIDSIKTARQRGASDEQILSELLKQNPSKAGVFQTARQRGASASMILSEIEKQNKQDKKQPKEKKPLFTKVIEGLSSFIGGKELATGLVEKTDRGVEEANIAVALEAQKLVDQAKKIPAGDPRRRQLLNKAKESLNQASGQTSSRLNEIPTERQVVGSAVQTGLTALTAGIGTGATSASRISATSALGGGFGGSQALREDKDIFDTAKSVAKGALGGAVFGTGFELARKTARAIPHIFSYSAKTPEEVLWNQFNNPVGSAKALQIVKEKGQVGVLNDIQKAVRELRTNLTKDYEKGSKLLVDSNIGKRIAFNSKEIDKLKKIQEIYGIDLPQNLNSVSTKEFLELTKELNSFTKKVIVEGPQGASIRAAKKFIKSYRKQFNGVDEFLTNYSDEKSVFDATNKLFQAFKQKDPTAQAGAMSKLEKVFSKNKNSYISALKQLEQVSGIPILDEVATTQLLQRVPEGILTGFLPLITALFRSPRLGGFASRTAGRISSAVESGPLQRVAGFLSGKASSQE